MLLVLSRSDKTFVDLSWQQRIAKVVAVGSYANALAAGCLGFGLRWAAGADAGGGEMETKKQFGLVGVAAPGPEFLGGQGVVPGWGLEVEKCWGSFEG